MGGFCLVVELHQEGSATNGATSSICLLSIQKACPGYTQTIKTDYDMHFFFKFSRRGVAVSQLVYLPG